jgi:hypothetical protein
VTRRLSSPRNSAPGSATASRCWRHSRCQRSDGRVADRCTQCASNSVVPAGQSSAGPSQRAAASPQLSASPTGPSDHRGGGYPASASARSCRSPSRGCLSRFNRGKNLAGTFQLAACAAIASASSAAPGPPPASSRSARSTARPKISSATTTTPMSGLPSEGADAAASNRTSAAVIASSRSASSLLIMLANEKNPAVPEASSAAAANRTHRACSASSPLASADTSNSGFDARGVPSIPKIMPSTWPGTSSAGSSSVIPPSPAGPPGGSCSRSLRPRSSTASGASYAD